MISKMKWILFAIFIFTVAFASDERKENEYGFTDKDDEHKSTKAQMAMKELDDIFRHVQEIVEQESVEVASYALEHLSTVQSHISLKMESKKTKINEIPNQALITELLNKIYERAEDNHTVQLVQDQCTICYENFPVFLQLPCARGHEFCAACVERILKVGDNRNCPKCRAPFPKFVSEWLSMIKIYPTYLTKDIPLEKLQIAFPLICCVAKLSTVTKCVKMGIDINTEGFQGLFHVHLASQTDVLKYLLEHGANVNQPSNNGATPLYMSAEQGHLSVVKYLVENGANVNQPSNDGVTPLYLSSQNGHLSVVQYLVKNGADVNQPDNDGFTPLFGSSKHGNLPVVQCLIDSGANVNQPNNNGFTPLFFSSQNGHLLVVQYLVENCGANVNQHNNNGATSLYVSAEQGHLSVVQYLVENKADVNQPKNNGVTPLYISSQNGHLLVVKYLVENKANVNQPNNDGATSLAIAIYLNHTEVAKFLLNKNANIEATKLFFENNNLSEQNDMLEDLCKQMKEQIGESNYKAKNENKSNCSNQ